MTDSPSTPAQLAINLIGTYGNPDEMADALAENVQWWISPSAPPEIMASLSTGREVVRGNMRRVFSLIYKPGTVTTTVHHAISEVNLATIRYTMHAQLPNGAPYENEYTNWIEVCDGQIVKVWEYVDAAWAATVMAAGGIDVASITHQPQTDRRNTLPAYIVVMVDIKDPATYEGYGEAWNFKSFAEDYGGELIMASNHPELEVLEGEWPGRSVVMKFPDAVKARGWYDSPEYHDVRRIRWDSSTTNMALIPGFAAAAPAAPVVEG